MNADPPKLSRQARTPARYEVSQCHIFALPIDYYRAVYFEVFDSAVGCLRARIVDKAIPVLLAIESLLTRAWNGIKLDQLAFDLICNHFRDDIDCVRLESQLKGIENLRQDGEENFKPMDIIRRIGDCTVKLMIPQVVLLCKLYLVCPATTATAERSFSLLRRLKSYLRSTMSETRLNSLLLLAMYSEEVDKLDIKKLTNEFILHGDTKRLNAFALLSNE